MPTNPQEPEPPAGYFQFEGLSPDGTGRCFFAVARDALLKHFRDTGNKRKLLEGYFVPGVLGSPAGIWKDLNRPGQEDTLCYAGVPSGRFVKDTTIEVPRLPKQVFVVFVSGKPLKDGQFKVLKWSWVEEDSARPGFPVAHETRFGKRLWPQD